MSNSTAKYSFPLTSILTIIFVIAKLTGHFDYSWWVVFAPIWVPLSFFGGLALIYFALWAIYTILDRK